MEPIKWIKVADQLPEVAQRVYYYSKEVGIILGFYDGMTDEGPCFGSELGWLIGKVSDWRPWTQENKDLDIEEPE